MEFAELEPYDELLDRQLWTHFATRLRWDKTLAARRRQDPLNAQALMEDLIMREHEAEMEEIPPMIDIDAPNEEIGGGGSCPFAGFCSLADMKIQSTLSASTLSLAFMSNLWL